MHHQGTAVNQFYTTLTSSESQVFKWPMGGKAKSRCCLGMLKVNRLRHSYLIVMKLENYGPTGEWLINYH